MAFKKIFKKDAAVAGVALTRLAGFAAALGGALWVVKGVADFVTNGHPEYIYEVAPVLFTLGLVGLHARLKGHGGVSGLVGGVLAWASLAMALAVVGAFFYLVRVVGEPGFTRENLLALFALIALTGLSIIASLVLLGIAVRRVGALPGRWRSFPLSMGVAAFPLMVMSEVALFPDDGRSRLLELPLVVLGLAWVMLGWRISRSS